MENNCCYTKQDVVVREVAGEIILVPVTGSLAATRCIFSTNEIGRFIWERLDGKHSVAAIHRDISACFDVNPEQAWEDLQGFVKEMQKEALIREVP